MIVYEIVEVTTWNEKHLCYLFAKDENSALVRAKELGFGGEYGIKAYKLNVLF